MPAVKPDFAFNTAASFTTNTNWQGYSGESTMSYLTQMAGLAVQNFVSAAAGIAVALALIRGHRPPARGHCRQLLGGPDARRPVRAAADLVVAALVLVWQGVPQNLNGYDSATGLEGARRRSPRARSPPGGDQGAWHQRRRLLQRQLRPPVREPQRAHELRRDARDPGDPRRPDLHVRTLGGQHAPGLGALRRHGVIFLPACASPTGRGRQPARCRASASTRPLGNLEGKEIRFGVPLSALLAVITTVTSCGAVNAMHDSFNALGGLVPLANIQLGEVVFGGVGSGLTGCCFFALLAVFLAGLMVGRTPEYIGKKIQTYEMKMVALAILIFPATILVFTGAAVGDWTGASDAEQRRPARLQRDAVRVHLRHRQQRLGLRRPGREQRLLQQRPGLRRCSSAAS